MNQLTSEDKEKVIECIKYLKRLTGIDFVCLGFGNQFDTDGSSFRTRTIYISNLREHSKNYYEFIKKEQLLQGTAGSSLYFVDASLNIAKMNKDTAISLVTRENITTYKIVI